MVYVARGGDKSLAQRKADLAKAAGYRTMRDIWDRATTCQVEMQREGLPVEPQDIWTKMGGEGEPPALFVKALKHEGYARLLDIRMRLSVLPEIKNLNAVRELSALGAEMCVLSLLETVTTDPKKVSMSDKIKLTKLLSDMYLRITPEADKKAGEAQDENTRVALDEEQQMKELLEKVPEEMREKVAALYRAERVKQLSNVATIHMLKDNEKLGHAKTG